MGHADQLATQIELDRRAGYSWRRATDESGVAVPVWNVRNDAVIGALGVAAGNLSNRNAAETTARLLMAAASNLSRRVNAMQSNPVTAPPLPFSGWPEMPTDMFPLSGLTSESGTFPEFLGE